MVKWSDSAAYDLHQIYNYISNDSPEYARKVISDMINKSENLESFSISAWKKKFSDVGN